MRRQIQPPSHLKVAPGLYAPPPSRFLDVPQPVTVVNHYAGSGNGIASEKLIPAIPGFRTSAAFLTSLSANLRIDPDLPSPLGTPLAFRAPNNAFMPPPSPLSFSTSTFAPHLSAPSPAESSPIMLSAAEKKPSSSAPAVPLDSLPQLTTYTAETEDDRIDGLRLVADSVAQQRQTASKMLIYHPLNLAIYAVCVAVLIKYLYTSPDAIPLLFTTLGGFTFSCLIAVRWATSQYLKHAETINWDWLGDDRMIVVKWGEEIIGSLVLGWADSAEGGKQKKGHGRRKRGKAVVRAWTVRGKYRGKGVGEGLLEEAVKVAGERGADGIVFDGEHANSKRVLPAVYNSFLDKQESRAEKALEKVADDKGNFRQRRSSPTWGSR